MRVIEPVQPDARSRSPRVRGSQEDAARQRGLGPDGTSPTPAAVGSNRKSAARNLSPSGVRFTGGDPEAIDQAAEREQAEEAARRHEDLGRQLEQPERQEEQRPDERAHTTPRPCRRWEGRRRAGPAATAPCRKPPFRHNSVRHRGGGKSIGFSGWGGPPPARGRPPNTRWGAQHVHPLDDHHAGHCTSTASTRLSGSMKKPSALTSISNSPNRALPDGRRTVVVRPVSPIRKVSESYLLPSTALRRVGRRGVADRRSQGNFRLPGSGG